MTSHQRHSRHNAPAARELRGMHTPAEAVLWQAIRDRQFAGLKFRRQHPIGPFVAGFCCPDRRLIVELDGGIHDAQIEEDAAREALLQSAGYTVLRFPKDAVLSNLSTVLDAICAAANASPPRSGTPPSALAPGESPWETRRWPTPPMTTRLDVSTPLSHRNGARGREGLG